MAKKRVRTPQPESEEPLFVGLAARPFEKIPQPVSLEETRGSADDIIKDLLGAPQPRSPGEEEKSIDSPKPDDSVDSYLKRQVLTEMYGTENPSDYDKLSLALKRML